MKLASYQWDGTDAFGVVVGDCVSDLSARWPTLRVALREAGVAALAAAHVAAPQRPLAAVRFAPVIPDAGKILCVGHNYESHRVETGRTKTGHPAIFNRYADSQIGHACGLVLPRVSSMLDYEGELAVVIGKAGRAIAAADALQHVAGYTCFNDASVRDWQWHTHQFLPGKNFPGTGACGPWMVTADEIPDPSVLHVCTRLNGQQMQSAPTADMLFPIPTLIAYISTFTPLSIGDLIVTGTPGGGGAKREPPIWMKAGDVVEVEIPGIGILVNPVVQEA